MAEGGGGGGILVAANPGEEDADPGRPPRGETDGNGAWLGTGVTGDRVAVVGLYPLLLGRAISMARVRGLVSRLLGARPSFNVSLTYRVQRTDSRQSWLSVRSPRSCLSASRAHSSASPSFFCDALISATSRSSSKRVFGSQGGFSSAAGAFDG